MVFALLKSFYERLRNDNIDSNTINQNLEPTLEDSSYELSNDFVDINVILAAKDKMEIGNQGSFLSSSSAETRLTTLSLSMVEKEEVIRIEVPRESKTMLVMKIGVVVNTRAGNIIVESDDNKLYEFDLSEVRTTFKPRKGDRVKLGTHEKRDAEFAPNEVTNKVVSVEPFRKENVEGIITSVEPNDYGVISEECIFYWDALSDNCGKSKQKEENGITARDSIIVEFQELNETKTFSVMDKNTSKVVQKVLRSVFIGAKAGSQISQISPTHNASFILKPGDEKEYKFQATAKHYGDSVEHFQITFDRSVVSKKFHFYRVIKIVVKDVKKLHPCIGTGANAYKNYGYTRRVFMGKRCDTIRGTAITPPNFVKIKFESYHVPSDVKDILLGDSTRRSINETLDTKFRFLRETLSMVNYATVFHNLLYLEETQLYHEMRKYDRPKVYFTRDNEYLTLQIDNIAESRPSLVMGDSVAISNPSDSQLGKHTGIIRKVLHNRVCIKFSEGFHSKYTNEEYHVQFEFSRRSLMKQHHAIDKVANYLDSNLLFPTKVYNKEKQVDVDLRNDGELYRGDNHVPWFNQSLNIVQKKAITNILQGTSRPMPYVIFGPPGTGKTLTLIEAILQISKQISHSRIMVATPSNSSADLITQYIIDSGVLEKDEFMRLVGENAVDRKQISSNILPYCGTIDISIGGTLKEEVNLHESGLQKNCNSKFLSKRRILIGTCITLGSLMQCDFPVNHFTHVVVDESGQCMETEIVIPLSFVDRDTGQIILAGDPMQLGPVVMSNFAINRGLAKSFLDRILDREPYQSSNELHENCYNPVLMTRLIFNYRSLPSILNAYNDLFYEKDLMPMVNDIESEESKVLAKLAPILPNYGERKENQGVFFVGVEGKSEQCSDSPSWFNKNESNSVCNFLLRIYKMGIQAKDVGIITPYTRQVKTIRTTLTAADLVLPKIGTVEEFQGQERQIILVSTVRSQYGQLKNDYIYSLGFVRSAKRMNVAISRAKSLLVVFGSPKLLCKDQNWKEFIKKCVENKCAVNVNPDIVSINPNIDENDEAV